MKIRTTTLAAAAFGLAALAQPVGASAAESSAFVAEAPAPTAAPRGDAVETSAPPAAARLVPSRQAPTAAPQPSPVKTVATPNRRRLRARCARIVRGRLVSTRGVRRHLRARGYRWVRSVRYVAAPRARLGGRAVPRFRRCVGYYVSVAYKRRCKYRIYSNPLTGRPFARRLVGRS